MAVLRVVAPLNIAFPGQNAPLTADPNAQPVSPWWQFWRDLWLRTGGETGVDSIAVQTQAQSAMALLMILPPPFGQTAQPPPVTISVGASPFTYIAPYDGAVAVTGGTVSAVGWSLDNSTFVAFATSGGVPVRAGNFVKVTYSALPTMTMVGS